MFSRFKELFFFAAIFGAVAYAASSAVKALLRKFGVFKD